jgi:hypothetical protein
MGVTTTGSARIAPTFQPPAWPQLTEGTLTAAGLPTEPFTTMHVDLVRSSPKGKWHAPGSDNHRCTHVTRVFGHRPTSLPVQQVSVIGEHDLCSSCAHQVRLPGPAGVLHVAAGLIVAAAQWVAEVERRAPGMGFPVKCFCSMFGLVAGYGLESHGHRPPRANVRNTPEPLVLASSERP